MLVFEGSTFEDGASISHRLVSTVTDLVKPVAGVRNVVVWEQDWRGGTLAEAELAFFAQDNEGNVWHLGEYPAEYEDGKIVASSRLDPRHRGSEGRDRDDRPPAARCR